MRHTTLLVRGCPIRISTDQGSRTAPRGVSPLSASFFGCSFQGIHRALLVALPRFFLLTFFTVTYSSHQQTHLSAYLLTQQLRASNPVTQNEISYASKFRKTNLSKSDLSMQFSMYYQGNVPWQLNNQRRLISTSITTRYTKTCKT
jgi:hypothetical protein